jgi:hypothetical protein
VAFADVRDKSKAFVGSISIVHVVLPAGLLICNARDIVLRLQKYAKLCSKFGVATARAFTLSAVLAARHVKIYVRIVRWTAF